MPKKCNSRLFVSYISLLLATECQVRKPQPLIIHYNKSFINPKTKLTQLQNFFTAKSCHLHFFSQAKRFKRLRTTIHKQREQILTWFPSSCQGGKNADTRTHNQGLAGERGRLCAPVCCWEGEVGERGVSQKRLKLNDFFLCSGKRGW